MASKNAFKILYKNEFEVSYSIMPLCHNSGEMYLCNLKFRLNRILCDPQTDPVHDSKCGSVLKAFRPFRFYSNKRLEQEEKADEQNNGM